MKIKTFDNFITEAKLEYSRNSDIEDVREYVHDPEVFVYANSKMLKFAELMCSLLNKHTDLNLYINGDYGKIDGDKVIMLFDRDSDKCVCIKPWKGRTVFASLYYFKNVDDETNIADFYMSSTEIGVVELIRTFCKIISNDENVKTLGNLNEALDVNQHKIIQTPEAKYYVQQLLKVQPGQIGCNVNKTWHGDWTEELKDIIRNGVDPFDIALSLETQKKNSPYYKYFGGVDENGNKIQKMNADKCDTLLWYIAAEVGIVMIADKEVNMTDSLFDDTDDWYQRVAKMDKASAEDLIKQFDVNMKSIEEIIDDYSKFYKAKGDKKLEILSYTPQLLVIPGKGGIGKTTLVKKMLEDRGLRKNIDYILTGSTSSDAESIYNTCYDYNGKIIILDDIPQLFSGDQRQSLWKNLISGNMGEYGEPSVPARTTTTRYYDIRKFGKNMRKRYYAEAGSGATMSAAKSREMEARLRSSDPSERKKAEREQEELEMTSQNINKPMTFTFKGVIIALSNVSPAEMKKEIGSAQSWQAISTRARIIELNPPGWVLWLKDKNIILSQTEDTSIPDDCTVIPRDMVDTYINFVEATISSAGHDNFNYRISKYVGKMMRMGREWKQIVEQRSRSEEADF